MKSGAIPDFAARTRRGRRLSDAKSVARFLLLNAAMKHRIDIRKSPRGSWLSARRSDRGALFSAVMLMSLFASACGHMPQTYSFKTTRPNDEALDLIARGLEHEGYQVNAINRLKGEVVTVWRDTGEDAPEPLPGGLPAH